MAWLVADAAAVLSLYLGLGKIEIGKKEVRNVPLVKPCTYFLYHTNDFFKANAL